MGAGDFRQAELEALVASQASMVASQAAVIEELRREVAALKERLGRNSGNSGSPPSMDSPDQRGKRHGHGGGKSGRSRGGQPGHKGNSRALVSQSDVDEFIHQFPTHCENCACPLHETRCEEPRRFQVTDVPPMLPHVTEYQQHAVKCAQCEFVTWPAHDTLPVSPLGPRLWSVVALLTGAYHLSRRSTVQLLGDVLGVDVSLGAVSSMEARVSEAVSPAVDEAWEQVRNADIKHTDGTTWYRSAVLCALWTVATEAATVFKILADGTRESLQGLFGAVRRGVLVSDRAAALKFWAMENRQVCWAHLLRKFVAYMEKGGSEGDSGRELLDYLGIMFAYWDDFLCGRITREKLMECMAPLQQQVEAALVRAQASGNRISRSCADILAHRAALWTFVTTPGVEPTNNHAERELRAFVLWRKRSFGTQSARGDLYAERLMTVVHTARKQKRNVLGFLTECCVAALEHARAPSLFAPPAR
jgi:transposase